MRVKQASKHELAGAVRGRYLRADRRGKAAILDELVASTGYHRMAAIRLLRQGPPAGRQGHGGRPRRYSSVVVGALRVAAEVSGWPCGKRLAPFLEELVPAPEAERALSLSDADRAALVAMSPATVDRRLAPYRRQLRPRVHPVPLPVGACWPNLQEGWWRLLRKEAFAGQTFADYADIERAVTGATARLNHRATPWVWGRPPSPRHYRRCFSYRL